MHNMQWEVEYTDEFGEWWDSLSEEEQISIDASGSAFGANGADIGVPSQQQD
ncbi:hypothetical protein [Desulfonatronospira thiodismutans]|uniref:hypothetical protein n=1 Tax=Desulfonatronospira thiodismutans TaxID=488939 RepID=UPI001ABF89A6|nr:hypothetical protein [Desulfonatronospira thiodismutans]